MESRDSDYGICLKSKVRGIPAGHWLGLCAFIAKGSDSIIGQGGSILKVMQLAKNKKNDHKDSLSFEEAEVLSLYRN